MTIRMQAPTNLGTGVVPGQRMPSGKSYVIESQGGQIEAEQNDVGALAGFGFVPAGQMYLMPANTPLSGGELVTILQDGLVRRATTADLGGGSGVSEAPLDGNTYGRVDTSWTQVLPSAQAADKLYVDSQDAKLQQSIDKLSQNLVFVGQMKVVTDTANFTSASGIPPGHLPTAAMQYVGFYVIVSDGGSPPAGSHIPPGNYARGDWIVCDSSPAWNWLQLGRTDVTAPQVAVIPTVGGQTNVQATLEYLEAQDAPGSTLIPLMNGVVSVGNEQAWSHGDHVHPPDSSRYAANNPANYQSAAQVTAALVPYQPKVGVTDGSDAPAGQIGEYLSAQRLSTSPLTLTTNVDTGIATLSLSPGDWDVWGSVGFNLSANNNTTLRAWINPTGAGAAPSVDQMGGMSVMPAPNNMTLMILPVTNMRIPLTAPVTIRLGATATFTGTVSGWGKLMARRRR